MPVQFDAPRGHFHLYNNSISYIIEILSNGQMANLYFGQRVSTRGDYSYLHESLTRPHGAYYNETSALALEFVRQEYPSFGTGDFRQGAFQLLQENGSFITDFVYQRHHIYAGKKPLNGLPSTYVEENNEATSLEIELYDAPSQTRLFLCYCIYETRGVLTRQARFAYEGNSQVTLTSALSACLDLPDHDYQLLQLSGAWGRERHVYERTLCPGVHSIYSLRGISGAEHNPFLLLKRSATTEDSGEAMAFSFVYSGNFLAQIEVGSHHSSRLLFGIHPENFNWSLSTGESFQTPELVIAYSSSGMNQLSQTLHQLYQQRLVRGYWRDRPRPVIFNSWEAVFMEVSETRLLSLAEKAAPLGIELMVLDDGWFGQRNNDSVALGDWQVNPQKFPGGLQSLIQKLKERKLDFGLWIEPEMVSQDSELFTQNPHWVLKAPNRSLNPSRHQHVLDLANPQVTNYLFDTIAGLLRENDIRYIKWDMNRYLTHCYSPAYSPQEQGKVLHCYILGVYHLWERLLQAFPQVLFESCAAGGARFDPGMLYYSPQIWCSDSMDALERLKIQYGTSFAYPLSSISAHVSAIPNHQVRRNTPLNTRGNVSFFGVLGYELDIEDLTPKEFSQIKEQISFYKQHQRLLHRGNFYRLLSPFVQNQAAWMVVSQDGLEAIVCFCQILAIPNPGFFRLQLRGLQPEALYSLVGYQSPLCLYGSQLMRAGLPLDIKGISRPHGDYSSLLLHLSATSAPLPNLDYAFPQECFSEEVSDINLSIPEAYR